jgi:hypothetical protein
VAQFENKPSDQDRVISIPSQPFKHRESLPDMLLCDIGKERRSQCATWTLEWLKHSTSPSNTYDHPALVALLRLRQSSFLFDMRKSRINTPYSKVSPGLELLTSKKILSMSGGK